MEDPAADSGTAKEPLLADTVKRVGLNVAEEKASAEKAAAEKVAKENAAEQAKAAAEQAKAAAEKADARYAAAVAEEQEQEEPKGQVMDVCASFS